MRTLEDIKNLLLSAKRMAIEASPSKVEDAIAILREVSTHCKELYASTSVYMERAICRRLYENVDGVIMVMQSYGFCHDAVASFFGLKNFNGGSFNGVGGDSDMSRRRVPFSEVSDPAGCADILQPVEGKDSTDESERDTSRPKEKIGLPPIEIQPSPDAESVAPDEMTDDQTDENGIGDDGEDAVDDEPPVVNNDCGDPEHSVPNPAEVAEGDGVDGESPAEEVFLEDSDPTGVIPIERGNALEPQSLSDFIGQKHIVNRLMEDITAAKMLGKKYLDNILLFGNRGLGKSTLMELIAKEMDVDFELIDCTAFANNHKSEENFHSFFLNIIEKDRPVVIAFDEIHALSSKMQSKLLVLLQKRVYSYVAAGKTHNVPVKDFTFVAATTDSDAVLRTIKDRCSNLKFTMTDYTRDELTQIFCNKLDAMGLKPADDEVVSRCVNRFRGSLRDINAIVKGIYTKAVVSKTDIVTISLAEAYFSERGLDAIGLDMKELEILRAIKAETRGAISEETLAARVYLDPKVLTKEYEPYLMKIGFISVNSRGRSLTPKAEDYLKYGYYDFGNGIYIGTNPYKEKAPAEKAPDPKQSGEESENA